MSISKSFTRLKAPRRWATHSKGRECYQRDSLLGKARVVRLGLVKERLKMR